MWAADDGSAGVQEKTGDVYQDLIYSKGAYVLHMLQMMYWTPQGFGGFGVVRGLDRFFGGGGGSGWRGWEKQIPGGNDRKNGRGKGKGKGECKGKVGWDQFWGGVVGTSAP